MHAGPVGELTEFLRSWAGGDAAAFEALIRTAYPELRTMAARYVNRERSSTIQATALVHDLYLRLVKTARPNFSDRRAFFAFAAGVMRHILIDQARARQALRRGADRVVVSLDEMIAPAGSASPAAIDLLDLDEALNELAALDARKAELVQLCAFLGCSRAEAADILGISVRTVKRDFRMARAWLGQRLGRPSTSSEASTKD